MKKRGSTYETKQQLQQLHYDGKHLKSLRHVHAEVRRNNWTHELYVPSIHEKNLDCSIREAKQNRMFRAYPFFQEWHFRILGPSSFSSSGRTANRNNEKKNLRFFFFSQTANIYHFQIWINWATQNMAFLMNMYIVWSIMDINVSRITYLEDSPVQPIAMASGWESVTLETPNGMNADAPELAPVVNQRRVEY